MTEFLYFVLIGIATGSVYALAGVGLSIVFSSSQLLNFSQGYLVVIGALVASTIATGSLATLLLGALAAVVVATAVAVASGLGVSWAMIKRDVDLDLLMIGTVGLAIAIENLLPTFFGHDPQLIDSPLPDGGIAIGSFQIPWGYLVMFVGAVVVAAGVLALYRFTDVGLRLRALASDIEATRAAGVGVRSSSLAAWALSGAIGGIAGVLIGIQVPTAYHDGLNLSIFGFAAAMIGGLSSPAGSFVGGIVYGVIVGLASAYLPGSLQPFVAPAVILAVITLRPGGLLPVRHLRQV